jgi:hypothetical protein
MENRSGLSFNPLMEGERFEGSFNHTVKLAGGKFAVFENSREFVLVPWKPSFEDFRRGQMSISAGPDRSWDIMLGRTRGLGIAKRFARKTGCNKMFGNRWLLAGC